MLHLVEASSMAWRMFTGYPDIRRSSDDMPVNVAHGCGTEFWRLVKRHPTHVAVVLDKGRCTYRTSLYPEYKAQRPPRPDDLTRQMPFIREAAEAFGFAVVEMENVEADDLVATLAHIANEEGHGVTIHSTDKDMFQLIGGQTVMYDPMKDAHIAATDVYNKFGVMPEDMVDFQAMVGDTSDNIFGIKGVGKKRAAELLQQFGSLQEAYARRAEIKRDATRSAVDADGMKALANRALTRLRRDVAVPWSIDDFVYPGFEARPVLDFLDRMELVTLRTEIARGMMVDA